MYSNRENGWRSRRQKVRKIMFFFPPSHSHQKKEKINQNKLRKKTLAMEAIFLSFLVREEFSVTVVGFAGDLQHSNELALTHVQVYPSSVRNAEELGAALTFALDELFHSFKNLGINLIRIPTLQNSASPIPSYAPEALYSGGNYHRQRMESNPLDILVVRALIYDTRSILP